MQTKKKYPGKPTPAGLTVKTGLKAGNWNCRDCEGQVMGNAIFKANCRSCQAQ